MAAAVHLSLPFGGNTVGLCLTGQLLGPLFGSSIFPGSLTGSSFQTGFLFASLLHTAGVLAGCRLCSCFLASQLFLAFLLGGSGLCGLALGLCLSTCLGFSHLDGHQSVDLCIQRGVFLLLVVNHGLNGLLLFLQRAHHLLLFHLLVFQRRLFFTSFAEQRILLSAYLAQLFLLLVNLLLFGLH